MSEDLVIWAVLGLFGGIGVGAMLWSLSMLFQKFSAERQPEPAPMTTDAEEWATDVLARLAEEEAEAARLEKHPHASYAPKTTWTVYPNKRGPGRSRDGSPEY